MVSSYVGSMTQQLSPRQLHLSQSWPLIAPSQGCASQPGRGSSCEYEVPLPYSAADATWDISLDPIWKITAAIKSARQDSSAAATTTTSMSTPTSAPLSPLAQRAADAAVRAAAGWLSPGQWRSAQASSCSSPGKPTSQSRGSSAAAAQVAQRQSQISDDGLVVFRPRRWLAAGASDLESSIVALADALGVLQGDAYSEAFPPPPADARQLSRPAEACAMSWQPRYQPPLYDERVSGCGEDWDDGDDSVDGELGRSGDLCEEPVPLQLQRSCSSDFFSACSDSLSASEERCHSAESSPTQVSPPQLQTPLAAVSASTIRHNMFSQFPPTAAFKSDSMPPQAEEPASAQRSQQLPCSQVPALSPFAMATARGTMSEGPGLRTPFATACLASPFEAPSPRDMHLSPAEERLVPTPSLVGRAGAAAGDAAEGESPRETAERERASRMLACLWANTEKAPWAEEAAVEPREAKSSKPVRSATPPSCAAQQKSSSGAMGKRLFGIVADNQSEWQPLVRESNQVMELAGLDTEWLLHDLLVYADAVYA